MNSFSHKPILTPTTTLPSYTVTDPSLLQQQYLENANLEYSTRAKQIELATRRAIFDERKKADHLASIADHLNNRAENMQDEARKARLKSHFFSSENEELQNRIHQLVSDNESLRTQLAQRDSELKALRLSQEDFGAYDHQVRTQFDVISP